MKIVYLVASLCSLAPLGQSQSPVPLTSPDPDARFVNDDAGEVDAADVADGSLLGADVSTTVGDVTHTGGRVGLGTSSPTATLDVSGPVAIYGQTVIDGSGLWVGPIAWPHDGGVGNVRSGYASFLGGGRDNQLLTHTGYYTSVPADFSALLGGRSNAVKGARAVVGGGRGNVAYFAGVVGGGEYGYSRYNGVVLGGRNCRAGSGSGLFLVSSAIAGGDACGGYHGAAVGGGYSSIAGFFSSTGGGHGNWSSRYGAIGGGQGNASNGSPGEGYGAVGGGLYNSDSGGRSAVPGGARCRTLGRFSGSLGGADNSTGAGGYALAAGRAAYAYALDKGAFVWADGSTTTTRFSTGPDEFSVFASGGVRLFTDANATSGVLLPPGSGAWSSVSDREAKTALEPVDSEAVLESLVEIAITTWAYRGEADGVRHLGPVAQDFHAAFGLGADERMIDAVDADGVVLAAVQALYATCLEREAELDTLRKELAARAASDRAGVVAVPSSSHAFSFDERYVNDDAGEVQSRDVVDGSLVGADVSTANGDVTHTGGNVGFGTTTPAARLDVGGNVAVSGTEVIDLAGDWVGPAAWPHDGGVASVASGAQAFLGGGQGNQATNGAGLGHTVVGGGRDNTASGDYAVVGGGHGITASGQCAFAGGGTYGNIAAGPYAMVGGGTYNTATASRAVVLGGQYNDAKGTGAAVGGGLRNLSRGDHARVGGGIDNSAAQYATVVGGVKNVAAGACATVGGGGSFYMGGNNAYGAYSVVCGGDLNQASGACSTVPMGRANEATSPYSFAAGRYARATHIGAFVWGDSSGVEKASDKADQFVVYAGGGARFLSDSLGTTGVVLQPGSGTWSSVSDREKKENVEPVDPRTILERVVGLPLATWSYRSQTEARHLGPMAQDFHAAFGVGESERLISTVDADGVALAALQGLILRLREVQGAVDELRARLSAGGGDASGRPGAGGRSGLERTSGSSRYVEDDRGQVDAADVVDGSLTGADVSTTSGDVTHTGGNVGIGTATPAVQLDVAGALAVNGVPFVDANGVWVGPEAWPHDGGLNNVASGVNAFIGGGEDNQATNGAGLGHTTVGGGRGNTASGDYATVFGGRANVAGVAFATVLGGATNAAVAQHATIGGGYGNQAMGPFATVVGGDGNTASGSHSSVGGGQDNLASGDDATVGGGLANSADGLASTVSGGWNNQASGDFSTVSGGRDNTASGSYATVAGGRENVASGAYSIVVGGRSNTAQGAFSFAAGRRAKALHDGSLVWGDSVDLDKTSSAANQFNVYACGGVIIFSDTTGSTGARLQSGSGTWSSVSDRDAKEAFAPVSYGEIVERLAELPIATWNYRAQPDQVRHIGPMAQDFFAAFGLGPGERTIDVVDADGVALAAVHGIHELLVELGDDLAKLRRELFERGSSATCR